MDKIIIPSGKAGDRILQAYKDAGYKFKKPKHHKIKIKQSKGLLEDIKSDFYYKPLVLDSKAR